MPVDVFVSLCEHAPACACASRTKIASCRERFPIRRRQLLLRTQCHRPRPKNPAHRFSKKSVEGHARTAKFIFPKAAGANLAMRRRHPGGFGSTQFRGFVGSQRPAHDCPDDSRHSPGKAGGGPPLKTPGESSLRTTGTSVEDPRLKALGGRAEDRLETPQRVAQKALR